MAGIYIKNMSMPQGDQLIVMTSDGVALLIDEELITLERSKVIPVLPHGDLIDRSELKNKKITIDYDKWDDTFDDGVLFVTNLIDAAPIIIPASKEESE